MFHYKREDRQFVSFSGHVIKMSKLYSPYKFRQEICYRLDSIYNYLIRNKYKLNETYVHTVTYISFP